MKLIRRDVQRFFEEVGECYVGDGPCRVCPLLMYLEARTGLRCWVGYLCFQVGKSKFMELPTWAKRFIDQIDRRGRTAWLSWNQCTGNIAAQILKGIK